MILDDGDVGMLPAVYSIKNLKKTGNRKGYVYCLVPNESAPLIIVVLFFQFSTVHLWKEHVPWWANFLK